MEPITYPAASKALAHALTEGAPEIDGIYYITAAEPEVVAGDDLNDAMTVYMVAFMGNDPEESDEEGDRTGFIWGPDGEVLCTGPVF